MILLWVIAIFLILQRNFCKLQFVLIFIDYGIHFSCSLVMQAYSLCSYRENGKIWEGIDEFFQFIDMQINFLRKWCTGWHCWDIVPDINAIIDQCLYIHTHLWYRKNPTAILVFALLILIIVSLNNGRHRFLLIQFEYQSILRLFRSYFWIDSILVYYLITNLTSSSGEFQICFVMRCVFFKCCSNKVCSWSPVL